MSAADVSSDVMPISPVWRQAGILLLVALAGLLALYWQTAVSMVSIWTRSETFAHGYVIAPISLWLIWRIRKHLLVLTPRPQLFPCILLLGASLLWCGARMVDVAVLQQFAFVAMLPLTVWAVLGWQVSRVILFPLAFLLLMVPFGEVFLLPMMNFTADFTVAALRLSGMPVYREGLTFMIPSGQWSVVEACSGLRYLIASFTLGLLYAYLTYQSWLKRTLFTLVAILAPIIANGLRAYMIVMLGHYSDMKLAVGVDHLIYGWVFFGIVMLALYWFGAYWREDEPAAPPLPSTIDVATGNARLWLLPLLACMALGPLAASWLARSNPLPVVAPQLVPTEGWQVSAPSTTDIEPNFGHPAAIYRQNWHSPQAAEIGVFVAWYAGRAEETPLISSGNRPYTSKSEGEVEWRLLQQTTVDSPLGPVRQMLVRGTSGTWLVQQVYWISGRFEANDYRAKLIQLWGRLNGHLGQGAAILAYVRVGESPEQYAPLLRQFWQSQEPGLQHSLQRALEKSQ